MYTTAEPTATRTRPPTTPSSCGRASSSRAVRAWTRHAALTYPDPLTVSNGIIVMKFGGTSVADAGASSTRPSAWCARARRAARSWRCSRRAARPRTSSSRWRTRSRPSRTRARWTCCSRPASGSPARCARWRSTTWAPGDLAVGVAGRHRDRHLAHQGADPRRARRPHPRGPRRGQDRAGRRVPGRVHVARRDDPRPRRVRHHGGRAGRRAGRRRVRDLHRRGRRLLRRPADRARRAQAAGAVLRGDARDVGLGRQGAAAALGRVRAQLRRADPRAAELR